MIPSSRFVETSDNRDAWLAARIPAVTATEVASAATPSGFKEALAQRLNPVEVVANDYMKFGSDNEDWIARNLKDEFGILPNRWLIASADNALHMATPDGLSLDHTLTSEIKTGGREPSDPSIQHRRQVQWQMRCDEFATKCIYAFVLRVEVNGVYVPAWMGPRTWVIERDEKMIADLTDVADRLIEETEKAYAYVH